MVLKVERISKKNYGDYLFQDVSFEANHGIVAVIGRSGSGKSTLLKCIADLIPFDSGKVLLDGR
jgi:ABC-type multidrug transport system ATPase subunit